MKNESYAKKLSELSTEELMHGMDTAVLNEKKATHVVLRYIYEISERKLFQQLGYESVYKLLTERHKSSGNQAYDRIDAARVLKIKPDIASKVESGRLNLTQMIKVGQCIKQKQKAGGSVNQEQLANILSQIENQTIFETEKVLAVEMDFAPKQFQKLTPQRDESVRVAFTLTAEQFALVQKVQSLVSHSLPSNDLAELFLFLAEAKIKKFEGRGPRSKREAELKKDSEISNLDDTKNPPDVALSTQVRPTRRFLDSRLLRSRKRKYISIFVRRRLMSEANHECTYVDEDSKKCISKFCLQVDHVVPLARGGSDSIDNLRVLCGFHNRLEARRWNLSLKKAEAR